MNFHNLWAFFFLLLVPILILLYFLKLKRPKHSVASTLLWQKVIDDLRVNSPFQRLKKSLLLLIQLILLLLLIFALANPWLKSLGADGTSYIIILDTSGSMQAKDKTGKMRLDLAKEKIDELIEGMDHKSEMSILSFDLHGNTHINFTGDKRRLKAVLKKITASETPTDIESILKQVKSIADTRADPNKVDKCKIILYSDGKFNDPGKVELPVKMEYEMIGKVLPNIAITGMEARRLLRKRSEIELFVSVQNFSDQNFSGNMLVYLNDNLLDSQAFELPAQKSLSKVFGAEMQNGGVLKVEFQADDALAFDNVAYQVVDPPTSRRVLLVSDNPAFLETNLRAAKDIELTTIAPSEFPKYKDVDFNTVVWSNVKDALIADANNIYFGCIPKDSDIKMEAKPIVNPDISDWDSSHPIISNYIDFTNLLIGEAMNLSFPKDARIVLRSSDTPLIGLYQRKGKFIMVSGFNIFKSLWPRQPSFVIFLHKSLSFFDQQQSLNSKLNIKTGKVITVGERPNRPSIIMPDKSKALMTPASGIGYSYSKVKTCGIYKIVGKDAEELQVAVNLFSRMESNLQTVSNPIAEQGVINTSPKNNKQTREYFRDILAVILLIILLEWAIFHRRILT